MIDLMPAILQTLETDQAILNLCGGNNKVYQYTVPQSLPPPYIRVADLNNTDGHFADNSATSSDLKYQIDAWDSAGELIKEVNRVMQSLGFYRYFLNGNWDTDVSSVRKIARYRKTESL